MSTIVPILVQEHRLSLHGQEIGVFAIYSILAMQLMSQVPLAATRESIHLVKLVILVDLILTYQKMAIKLAVI